MSMTSAFGMRDLHADRGRQAVAHGAEPARGHPAVRLLELEELRRPHLVLADLGGDVDVAVLGQLVEPLDRVLRLDDVVRVAGRRATCARATCRSASTSRASAVLSGCCACCATAAIMSSSTCAQSPTIGTSTRTFLLIDDGSMSMWIFFESGRERVEPAGDAVVEARADADHHVAIVHRHVGFVGAVHAEHAEPLRIGRRKGAEPHQRRGDRKAGQLARARAAARSPPGRN